MKGFAVSHMACIASIALAACKPGDAGKPAPAGVAPGVPASGVSAAYAADIRAFCDGPNDPTAIRLKQDAGSMTLNASQLVRIFAEIVKPRLTTDEGMKFFRSLASESIAPADKAARLREQARLAGLSTCAFADIWDPPHR